MMGLAMAAATEQLRIPWHRETVGVLAALLPLSLLLAGGPG
jgi:hypothetical protein